MPREDTKVTPRRSSRVARVLTPTPKTISAPARKNPTPTSSLRQDKLTDKIPVVRAPVRERNAPCNAPLKTPDAPLANKDAHTTTPLRGEQLHANFHRCVTSHNTDYQLAWSVSFSGLFLLVGGEI